MNGSGSVQDQPADAAPGQIVNQEVVSRAASAGDERRTKGEY